MVAPRPTSLDRARGAVKPKSIDQRAINFGRLGEENGKTAGTVNRPAITSAETFAEYVRWNRVKNLAGHFPGRTKGGEPAELGTRVYAH